jgi:putative glutamine amidotransferase
MATLSAPTIHIGTIGPEERCTSDYRGCGLWAPGYHPSIKEAGGTPVNLGLLGNAPFSEDILDGMHGLVFTGAETFTARILSESEKLVRACRERNLPLLAVDQGALLLNLALGGTNFQDLSREQPEALQHRHPPERGLRHAINVLEGTRLAEFYGEGEIVVNSEHRAAVARPARGFQVSGQALDGVIEAIETTGHWFAMGVQWRPASGSASGLDIQVFRGLIDVCREQMSEQSLRLAA